MVGTFRLVHFLFPASKLDKLDGSSSLMQAESVVARGPGFRNVKRRDLDGKDSKKGKKVQGGGGGGGGGGGEECFLIFFPCGFLFFGFL